MAFWSAEKLALLLPNLITPYNPSSIDCASYILRLGDQAFVTKDDTFNGKPDAATIQVLNNHPPDHTVCINPGQFAYLLTEESVTVPNHAIAFINMKTKLKFKGLINVSGFHVDPGFSNKLLFGVYNAGPQPIILERKRPLAMIVYADLDQPTSKIYKGAANSRRDIGIDLVQDMTGQVFSPMALQRQMNQITADLSHIRTRGKLIDGAIYTIVAAVFSTVLALITLEPPKILFGGFVKSSMDLYINTIQKEVKELSISKQTTCPETPCDSFTSTKTVTEKQQ